ncbi:MAG TPA: L-threonylcarbamoyladenylate synthase [Chthoniobacterales bacterium]|jgi:L-threonylcarbamoyladenylate synthase|nr:L-threonylcarbamoyladenylate synthase [Chthoniobacterales bacterium]
MTRILPSRTDKQRAKAVAKAAELLRAGEAIALPTETVYGLAAHALNPDAVAKIFEAKERPRFDPLIVHLPDPSWLDQVARIEKNSRPLIKKMVADFWPGPFTLILPRRKIIPEIVTAGLATVAVRISAHPLFAEIIRVFGAPLAAPSANQFGRVSPTTAPHVLDELNGRIPLIVDAGSTLHGIESTIVAVRKGQIELLRRGPITAEQLENFGKVVWARDVQRYPKAPGRLPSHYAPCTQLILVDDPLSFVAPKRKKCGLLAWRHLEGAKRFAEIRSLSSTQDLREAAANLFRYLHELDQLKLDLIVAEKVPNHGLGAAIMDRLQRASTAWAQSSKSEIRNSKQIRIKEI